MSRQLRWGILGTGNIARQFAQGLRDNTRNPIAAVASRSRQSADQFARQCRVPTPYAAYEQLLADPSVDAVYVSLPNSLHHQWTIKSLLAGKHVLCEKPIAAGTAQAQEMFDAAQRQGLLLVEAFMYRSHPLTIAWLEQIRSGAIGQIKIIRASFCFCMSNPAANIRFSSELAGGALMDVGCYCIHLSRLLAGAEPKAVHAFGHLHHTGVDDLAAGTLIFPNGILASFTCGMTLHADNAASILGSNGYISIPVPWKPGHTSQFTLDYSTPPKIEGPPRNQLPQPKTFLVDSPMPLYALQAEAFASSVFEGKPPAISSQDSLGNMRILDQLRSQLGVRF